MRIGIIVHSKTGHTLSLGRHIADELRGRGHKVGLIQVEADSPVRPRDEHVDLVNAPDPGPYDTLLIGGPVWGFMASPVIMACIKSLGDIGGKRVVPFVTMGFPFPSMGGRQAITQMNNALACAGAMVLPGTIVPRLFHNANKLMDKAAGAIGVLLS